MRKLLVLSAALIVTASGGAFAANAAKPVAKAHPTLSARFTALDTNHDGFLTKAELKAGKVNSYIRADANHDGKVSLAELNRRMAPKSARNHAKVQAKAHAKVAVKTAKAAPAPKRG